jgi:hypothetical protein
MCPQQLDHKDARIHCAILNKHATHHPHTRPAPTPTTPPTRPRPRMLSRDRRCPPCRSLKRPTPTNRSPGCSFRTQQGAHTTHQPHPPTPVPTPGPKPRGCTKRMDRCRPWLASVSATEHPTPTSGRHGLLDRFHGQVLLRKEVIQPHLPVRLPCYDFVPIASPTFDGSLHKGWATGFGCCRLS